MRIQSLLSARVLIIVAAVGVGMVGLAVAEHTAGSSIASSTPTTSTHPGPTTGSTPSATVPAAPPTSAPASPRGSAPSTVHTVPAPAVQQLKFPNSSDMVVFTGYDAKDNMAEFQKVVRNPKVPVADLIPDPDDPAVHRLPMAPGTDVTSIDPGGFPFETCPPVNCTSDDMIQSVMSHTTLWAHIQVNSADQISVVNQLAY